MGSEARTCRSASIHSNMARCSASPKLSGQKKASAEARVGSGEWGAGSGELGVEAGEVRPRWDAQLQHTCRKNPPAGPAPSLSTPLRRAPACLLSVASPSLNGSHA